MTADTSGGGAQQACGTPSHVLVVDDVMINRVVLAAQAHAIGFSALMAQGGEEAVNIFAERHSSLAAVFLDLQMPGHMSGWDAARAMRKWEAEGCRRRSVIVVCTACPLDQAVPDGSVGAGCMTVREFTLACGADAVVNKPIATSALRLVVRSLLQQREEGSIGVSCCSTASSATSCVTGGGTSSDTSSDVEDDARMNGVADEEMGDEGMPAGC